MMGYVFSPNNRELDDFSMGAFLWPILMESFGYLFPEISRDGRYFYLKDGNGDRRYCDGKTLGGNGGFEVSAYEAVVMARMARNYSAIQRELPESNDADNFPFIMPAWPRKISPDYTARIDQFANWAERSGGFTIM